MDRYDERIQYFTISSISYDSLSSSRESEIVEFVDYPFNEFTTFQLVGSCNGLVCIWYGSCDTIGTGFIIFNPATKEYKRISKLPQHVFSADIKAFGYDCKADDYKLIISVESHGTELLYVYMLGANEWKNSRTVPAFNLLGRRKAGIFVNGAFHWFSEACEGKSSKSIVSLDISNEKFDKLQLPEVLIEKKYSPMTIEVLEWCLCVLVTETRDCLEVWVMQDYGVQESWVQRYITGHQSIMRNFELRYMWSLKNGQFLLRNGSQLVIYDPKDSSSRELNFSWNLGLFDAKSYVESLVSLNSGTYVRRK